MSSLLLRAALATPTLISRTTASEAPKCTTAIPGKNGHVDPLACNAYWAYDPSFGAAIALSVIFGALLVAHIAQAIRYKKFFCWVLCMGVAWEFISFVSRSLSTRQQQSLPFVLVSQLFFLLAPLWINAFAYMTLGRLIHYFHPQGRCLGIKAKRIALYFVLADIVSFIIQGIGGSMLNPENSPDAQDIGKKLYMGGMGFQEFCIVLFTILGIKFQLDMQKLSSNTFGQARLLPDRTGWRMQIYTLYAVLTCITVRIIFRLAEYASGTGASNPIPYHEAYIYCLDALPMFIATVLLVIFHPGRVLVGPDSEFASRKEKKELKRQKKEEKRRRKEGNMRGRVNGRDDAGSDDGMVSRNVDLEPGSHGRGAV